MFRLGSSIYLLFATEVTARQSRNQGKCLKCTQMPKMPKICRKSSRKKIESKLYRVMKSPLPPFDKGGLGGIFRAVTILCVLCVLCGEDFLIFPRAKDLLPFSASLCYKKLMGEKQDGPFY
jgi:hypothetical protein